MRKTVQVQDVTKEQLQKIKKAFGLKNEDQVISVLLSAFKKTDINTVVDMVLELEQDTDISVRTISKEKDHYANNPLSEQEEKQTDNREGIIEQKEFDPVVQKARIWMEKIKLKIDGESSRKPIVDQLDEVHQKLLKGGTDIEWLDDPNK